MGLGTGLLLGLQVEQPQTSTSSGPLVKRLLLLFLEWIMLLIAPQLVATLFYRPLYFSTLHIKR